MFEAVVIAGLLGVADVQAPNPEDEKVDFFRVQLLVDGGFPDGLGLGLTLAPVPHIRLSFSGLTNIIGYGLRGGIAVVPFASWTLHPIFALDFGRYFSGDPREFMPSGPASFKYDFVDATAGLELMFRVVVLRVTGGVARVWATSSDATPSQQISIGGLSFQGVTPAVKLALALRLN